jgi:O-antigen/teichoic acid export membrane protein
MLAQLRSLGSDTLVYGTSTILGRFLTFLLTPLYTNFVTKSELGDTAYLYSLIAFVNVLYSCGFDSAFFKFFRTESDEEPASATKAHNQSVFVHAFLGIATISICITLVLCLIPQQTALALGLEVGATIMIYAALIPMFDALMLVPYAALRMERRAKRFAGTKFAIIIVNVAANIVFVVWLRMGIRGIFLAGLLSSFTGVILLVPELNRYLLRARVRFDAALLRELWRFGLPTVPAAFSAMMLQVIDRPILKLFVDSSAVGLYQANFRLGIPMMLVVTVFEYAWKPFYLRETSRRNRSHAERRASHTLLARVLTYFTIVCGLVFLLTALLIEYVVRMPFIGGRFVNPAYWSGLSMIPMVLGGYYFNGLFTNFAASVYIRKRTKYLPMVTGLAALTNVGLNLLLIPRFGIWGAAWTMLFSYAVSAGAMYVITRRIYPLRYEWQRVGVAVGSALMLFALARFTTQDMGLWSGFGVRCAWIAAYPFLLAAFGFFTTEEQALKRLGE